MKYCFYFLKTYKLKKYIALLLLFIFWKLQYNKRTEQRILTDIVVFYLSDSFEINFKNFQIIDKTVR